MRAHRDRRHARPSFALNLDASGRFRVDSRPVASLASTRPRACSSTHAHGFRTAGCATTQSTSRTSSVEYSYPSLVDLVRTNA